MVFRAFMSKKPSRRPLSALVCLASLSALSFALASGCGRSEAATERGSAPQPAAVAKGAKAESDTYVVSMKATGPYSAGKEGTVLVTVEPKGDYHINDQYPYKFKATDPAPQGIKYPKAVLKREDGKFEKKKGEFAVPFVVDKAGKATVSGTLSMSVCSDANCVMEKVDLELEVEAK